MKKQIFTALLAAVAMVFFFLPFTSLAQQATTSLNGVVTDPSGRVLSGATVTISRAANRSDPDHHYGCPRRLSIRAVEFRYLDRDHQRQRFCRSEQSRHALGQ